MSVLDPAIAQIVALMRQARSVVALTGAGVSTASGIPDFRSAGSGLWEQMDPLEVASLTAFRYRPAQFYKWLQPLAACIQQAQPNAAHGALAELEQRGQLTKLITQNIDGLHTRAGQRAVVELHGSLREAICGQCHTRWPGAPILAQVTATGQTPYCPSCGGVLKPDAVLLGEVIPETTLRAAREAVRTCDLLLVVGCSLEVMPAAALPYEAVTAGARLIIFNHDATYMDERADVILRADVAESLPRLLAALKAAPHAP